MKSIVFFIGLLSMMPPSLAQLTVKPTESRTDTYLYVKGNIIFVNQDVNLQKNADESPTEASMYLRNEGQLIQGEGGATTNKGDGILSVFQEGTSNSYDYNYWASPVGNGSSGNGNFGIEMFYSPRSQTASTKANNTTSVNGVSSPLTISNRWIFTYSGISYSDWYFVQNNTVIPAGHGFTMKGVSGTDATYIDGRSNNPGNAQRYDFRGRPNNGPVKVSVYRDENTLVGNPFPSALDLSLFLLENSGTGNLETGCGGEISRKNIITGVAYFWDSAENGDSHYLQDYTGGYGVFSPVDPCTPGIYEKPILKKYGSEKEGPEQQGKHYDRRFSPIGQGFLVKGASDGQLVFRNEHRVFRKEGELSDFKRNHKKSKTAPTPVPIPKLRLEVEINDEYRRSLTLGFWPTATSGTDSGMDAENFDQISTDIGWNHKGKSYLIDVRPFVDTDRVPLILKVDEPQARMKIKIVDRQNIKVKDVYLFDSESRSYYPLGYNPVQLIVKEGIYPERFKLVFEEEEEKATPPMPSAGVLHISSNEVMRRLEIHNPALLPIGRIDIFDLNGKKIFTNIGEISEFYGISTETFANSLYLIKFVLLDGAEIIKKFSVRNQD